MELITLDRIEKGGSWPDLRCYIMEHDLFIFFGPPSDYQIDGVVSDYKPERKVIRRFGEWSHTEVSLNAETGKFISFLLLVYIKPLPPKLADADKLLKGIPREKGIPIFSYEALPPAIDVLQYVYNDTSLEVLAQTGKESIRITLKDAPVVRYVEVSANFLIGISEQNKWVVAHFRRLKPSAVREFEEMVALYKYPSTEPAPRGIQRLADSLLKMSRKKM